MAVVSVEKQPQKRDQSEQKVSWIFQLVYKFAMLFIGLQCTRSQFPSKFPLKMLKYSADNGHVKAMARLGQLLYGSGACRTEKRSGLEYIRQAAKSDHPQAQYVLGEAYLQDDNFTQKNKQLAVHWLALASDNGHTLAAQKLQTLAEQDLAQQQAQQAQAPLKPAVSDTKKASIQEDVLEIA